MSALRVAVVGSGPAGFYAADALLKSEDPRIEVDVIDRLPTPWGLVRLGVAPDHENIKAVSRAFEKTAARPGFRFFGNVEAGRDVSHEELTRLYDAVVYTVGGANRPSPWYPGEDLPGSWPATAFVAWYNGHPDYQDLEFDLSHERAIVIGNATSPVDCVRMLALTALELAPTDTTDPAVEGIVGAGLEELVMLGRRGPVQAAFTPARAEGARRARGRGCRRRSTRSRARPGKRTRARGRSRACTPQSRPAAWYATRAPAGKPRQIVLRFLESPVAITGNGKVEAIEVVRNELVEENGRIVARPTGETETIACGIVLRSVGYKGVPLPGVPFDEGSGTIPNDPRPRRGGGAHLRRRLDQARPERRDRHEQERRDGDSRAVAPGCASRRPRHGA